MSEREPLGYHAGQPGFQSEMPSSIEGSPVSMQGEPTSSRLSNAPKETKSAKRCESGRLGRFTANQGDEFLGGEPAGRLCSVHNTGDEIALYEGERLLALMIVEEKFLCDKVREAREVYRTVDEAHPGVARAGLLPAGIPFSSSPAGRYAVGGSSRAAAPG